MTVLQHVITNCLFQERKDKGGDTFLELLKTYDDVRMVTTDAHMAELSEARERVSILRNTSENGNLKL